LGGKHKLSGNNLLSPNVLLVLKKRRESSVKHKQTETGRKSCGKSTILAVFK